MKTSGIRLSTKEKLGFISNLGTMLSAGIPILEAIDSILEDAKGNQKKVLEEIAKELKQGKQLHLSFAQFPKTFDKVTVNLVKASEEAGTLDETLKDLAENIHREEEFSDKIKSALTYPIFVLVILVVILTVILVFVIPRISTVFKRLDVNLPLPTVVMIAMSDFMLSYYPFIIAGILLFAVGMFFFYRAKKELFVNLFSAFPVVSQLVKDIDVTRFARSLSLLLSSGVPITSALELSEDVVVKKSVHDAVIYSKNQVTSGHSFSDALKKKKRVFPSIMIKIVEAGEKTGSLDKSMQNVSEYMDYQVSKSLSRLTSLLEPLMLVFVGLLVGGMMLAIIAPIYGIISQVGSVR